MSTNIMHRFLHFVQQLFIVFNIPEFETIPLAKLPYGFRQRIARLSFTAKIQHNFIRTCSVIDRREPYWDDHDQVFITDNHVVCKRAMKDTFLFRICKCLDQFEYWRKTKDGLYTFYPVWKSVLLVDEILDRKKYIYVHDTLILHCQIEGYEKVIPTIFGNYTRLVLHGRIRWDRLKRLIHDGVKQVRVSGIVRVEPLDYDEFVDFIIRHCRGIEYTFSFGSKKNYNHEIMARLYAACRNHNTHKVFYTPEQDKYHVAHKNIQDSLIYCGFSLLAFMTIITIVIPIALVFVPGSVTNLPNEVTETFFIKWCIFISGITFACNIVILCVPCYIMDVISDVSEPTDSI